MATLEEAGLQSRYELQAMVVPWVKRITQDVSLSLPTEASDINTKMVACPMHQYGVYHRYQGTTLPRSSLLVLVHRASYAAVNLF